MIVRLSLTFDRLLGGSQVVEVVEEESVGHGGGQTTAHGGHGQTVQVPRTQLLLRVGLLEQLHTTQHTVRSAVVATS